MITTIQQTAKRFKVASRLGGYGILIGLVWFINTQTIVPGLFLLSALITFMYGRFGKWFNHE